MKLYLDTDTENIETIVKKYQIEGIFSTSSEHKGDQVSNLPYFYISEDKILQDNKEVGLVITIDSPESMSSALEAEVSPDFSMMLIRTGDWHIIPLENLIAKFTNHNMELIAEASTPEEIKLLQNVLELGVDGCLLVAKKSYTTDELLQTIEKEHQTIELQEFVVTSVTKIGNGDRVCVDTVSNLKVGEGMLVGSTSAIQILVQAEVEESGFVNARPFRVNAGVVASYTMNFDKTNYLSELSAGSTVMITNFKGQVRKEYVARVKIERRPLIVVKVTYKDKEYPVVLQDAETVKVISPNGSIGVHQLQVGTKILGHLSEKGRHFGMEIQETIEEK